MTRRKIAKETTTSLPWCCLFTSEVSGNAFHSTESPDLRYTAAISACEKGAAWAVALGLLAEMTVVKVAKTAMTFGAAISACGIDAGMKGGQWELALGAQVGRWLELGVFGTRAG